jgi:hypothetical protein
MPKNETTFYVRPEFRPLLEKFRKKLAKKNTTLSKWIEAAVRDVMADFVECAGCAAKPGTPALCAQCVERRSKHFS